MERQLGQLLIKEHETASVLVSRALIFLVVNKTLIPSSWTTPMDYSYGQPLKWTTPLWFTDFPLKSSIVLFFLVNFSPALLYLNAWNSLIFSSLDQKMCRLYILKITITVLWNLSGRLARIANMFAFLWKSPQFCHWTSRLRRLIFNKPKQKIENLKYFPNLVAFWDLNLSSVILIKTLL